MPSAPAPPRRAGLALAAALAAALALQGCGFRPLYGSAPGAAAREDLAGIRIAPIADRAGQQLHNALRDRLNPRGQPRRPVYRLAVELSERTVNLGFRRDETATRAELQLTARFRIEDAASGERLLAGRQRVSNSYNIRESQFATIAAEEDARARGIRTLAEAIRVRVASFLARREAAL